MEKKIFSMPMFTGMSDGMFEEIFFPFLREYKEYIYDIYFTCIIPPFDNDAMGQGDIKGSSREATIRYFKMMMRVQEETGIKVSATFNDISVDSTLDNLDLFIKNLKPFYARGLRSITIPHYHWMLTNDLKKNFPEMTIKNTILRRVSKPQEYVDYAEVNFDVINIDRYNIRDSDNLKNLKRAYDRFKKPMSILVNEWCRGSCPAMSEHYQLNSSKSVDKRYFKLRAGGLTCSSWGKQSPSYALKNANMPIFREDFDEILNYIQILKLHGRSTLSLFEESMEIVKRYADPSEDIIMYKLYDQVKQYKYDPERLKNWREFTKNCKFECWDCKKCDELHNSSDQYGFQI